MVHWIPSVVTIWTGVTLAAHYKDARAWVLDNLLRAQYPSKALLEECIRYMLSKCLIRGSILINALPWDNKIGPALQYLDHWRWYEAHFKDEDV